MTFKNSDLTSIPVLIHDKGSKLSLGPGRLCCRKLKAVLSFPGHTTIFVQLNQDLDNFFRKKTTKQVLRLSEKQYAVLAQMPPVSPEDLEVFEVNDVTHYAFTDTYLQSWLIPLLSLLD